MLEIEFRDREFEKLFRDEILNKWISEEINEWNNNNNDEIIKIR